jgi:hypothetical protein
MRSVKNYKTITENVGYVSPFDFDGTLAKVVEHLQIIISKHGPDARLDYDSNYYYDYDTTPSPRYHIRKDRQETDAEYENRIAQSKAENALREEREKAEFERLSKKWGPK